MSFSAGYEANQNFFSLVLPACFTVTCITQDPVSLPAGRLSWPAAHASPITQPLAASVMAPWSAVGTLQTSLPSLTLLCPMLSVSCILNYLDKQEE